MPATVSKPIPCLSSLIFFFLLVRSVHVDVFVNLSLSRICFSIWPSVAENILYFLGYTIDELGGGYRRNTPKSGWDHESSQLADRHFDLAIFRQHQGTTAKSTDWGGDHPFKQTSRGTRKQLQQHESPQVRRLRSAGISKGRRRLTKTSGMIPAGWMRGCPNARTHRT